MRLLGILGLCWAATSLLWTADLEKAAWQLAGLAVLVIVFIVGSRRRSLDLVFTCLAAFLAVSVALCIPQMFGWSAIPQMSVPAGLLYSREALGEFAAPVAVWTSCQGRHWYRFLFFCPLPLTQSRVGVLSAALGLLYAWKRPWPTKTLALSLIALAGSLSLWLPGKHESAVVRVLYWIRSIQEWSWFGQGLGWHGYSHSDVLQAGVELGIGAVPFLLLPAIVLWRRSGIRSERAVLVTMCVQALVSFPLHMPATGFVSALVLGYLASESRNFRMKDAGDEVVANLKRPCDRSGRRHFGPSLGSARAGR